MSMVFKIMKPASAFYAVDYNEKKQEKGLADKVYFENFGYLQDKDIVTKAEFKKYLEQYSDRNGRIKNSQFHAVLSCKGKEYSFEQLKGQAIEMMKRLGYADIPMLIYEHRDTANNHIHIVTSRVGPDGKKIDHNLEGIRANKILNELLKIDPKQNFTNDLDSALSFNISTTAQFKLLMEQKGYKHKQEEKELIFFRHGHQQGRVDVAKIDQRIKEATYNTKRTKQIKALIYKYKREHSPDIMPEKLPGSYTTAKTRYYSNLSNHLQKTFGLEFIYFGAKDKEPYGYTIIDHMEKAVYKGSEIMKVEELRKPAEVEQKNKETTLQPISNTSFNAPESHKAATKKEQSTAEGEMNVGLGDIVDQALRDVEDEAMKTGGRRKKKRGQRR
jgi:hypothetical protein